MPSIFLVLGYYNAKTKEEQFFACFFVAYVETESTAGDFLFNSLHDAGLEVFESGKKRQH